MQNTGLSGFPTEKNLAGRVDIYKEKLFTNEKETRRAIKAAVDKYNEIYRNNTLTKHKRGRKNRAQNRRTQLRGNS